MTTRNRKTVQPSATFFTIWFVFCGLVGIGMLGLTVWAVITVVQWLVTK